MLWPVEIDASVPLLPEMVSKIDLSKRMSDFWWFYHPHWCWYGRAFGTMSLAVIGGSGSVAEPICEFVAKCVPCHSGWRIYETSSTYESLMFVMRIGCIQKRLMNMNHPRIVSSVHVSIICISKQSWVTVVTKCTATVITLHSRIPWIARIQPGRFRAFQHLGYELPRPNRPRRSHIIYTWKGGRAKKVRVMCRIKGTDREHFGGRRVRRSWGRLGSYN